MDQNLVTRSRISAACCLAAILAAGVVGYSQLAGALE
jgi:hypothetical protein